MLEKREHHLDLSEWQAPLRILERVSNEFSYQAFLKKRFGNISAEDFVQYGLRFAALCDQIYQGSELKLFRNRSVPVGPLETFLEGSGIFGPEGELISLEENSQEFKNTFDTSLTATLNIHPASPSEDLSSSFAQMEWNRRKPKTIFFYAQQNRPTYKGKEISEEAFVGGLGYMPSPRDLEAFSEMAQWQGKSQPSLINLLYRKMFHVPGSAPNLLFSVGLGIDATLKGRSK